ncbi:MAG: cupin domain-containing protein [Candidatus Marinimicrobia bacterium]|nr:cupin domain-containing protein [Candidatus Neomarinimicrobiota bacterium]
MNKSEEKMYDRMNVNFDDPPPWLSMLREELNLHGVALGIANIPKRRGYTFMHSHEEQEEVYIVLGGSGIIRIEDEDIDLRPGDFVKVSPQARRALKASDESDLLVIIAGGVVTKDYPRNLKSGHLVDDGIPDWDNLPPWCEGNPKIIEINRKLRAQREKLKADS